MLDFLYVLHVLHVFTQPNMPSYYVCLDHKYKKVLLCIRGTMSIRDALIDLQGDCKEIELSSRQPTWLAHMVRCH